MSSMSGESATSTIAPLRPKGRLAGRHRAPRRPLPRYDYEHYSRLAGPLTEPGRPYRVRYRGLLADEPHRVGAALLLGAAPLVSFRGDPQGRLIEPRHPLRYVPDPSFLPGGLRRVARLFLLLRPQSSSDDRLGITCPGCHSRADHRLAVDRPPGETEPAAWGMRSEVPTESPHPPLRARCGVCDCAGRDERPGALPLQFPAV